jgi:hypothetical protein
LKQGNEESKTELEEVESLVRLVESAVVEQSLSASTNRTDDELSHPSEPVPHGHDCPRAPPQHSC